MGRHGAGSRGGHSHHVSRPSHSHSRPSHSHHHGSSHHHTYVGSSGWGWNRPTVYVAGGPSYYGWYHPYGWRANPVPCLSCCCIFMVILFIILVASLAPKTTTKSGGNSAELASFESRVLSKNTNWYSGVDVTVNPPGSVMVYKFADVPPLTGSIPKFESQALSVQGQMYEYYAYYLNQGSTLTVSWNTSQQVQFSVIQSTVDWDQWTDGYDTHIFTYYGYSYTYTMQTNEADDFYFAWDNIGYSSVVGTATFSITLTDYDYSNPLEFCDFSDLLLPQTCTITFDQGTSDVCIVRALQQTTINGITPFSYAWKARTEHYWKVFGIAIGVVVTVVIVIIVIVVVIKRRAANATYTEASPSPTAPISDAGYQQVGAPPVGNPSAPPAYNPAFT